MGPVGQARHGAPFGMIGICYRCGASPTKSCFPMLNGKREIALEVRAPQFAVRRFLCESNQPVRELERITERLCDRYEKGA
jgi:hypothetical protein